MVTDTQTAEQRGAIEMRDAIAKRVQELIDQRYAAQVGELRARKTAEMGAQIATLNVVLAFVSSFKVAEG